MPEAELRLHTRHVGIRVFAAIMCRKFAGEATFSWHLPDAAKLLWEPFHGCETVRCAIEATRLSKSG
jgi:hypothetical protein